MYPFLYPEPFKVYTPGPEKFKVALPEPVRHGLAWSQSRPAPVARMPCPLL
jgi:hypothetical protein